MTDLWQVYTIHYNPYTTAFAKLTILPHPRARSSALTTPPMRFPIISFLLLMRTAALSSKRM